MTVFLKYRPTDYDKVLMKYKGWYNLYLMKHKGPTNLSYYIHVTVQD